MKKQPERLQLEYLGIKSPQTYEEIEFEILGLETLIAEAHYKITQLKQGKSLAKLLEKTTHDSHHSKKTK